MPSTSSQPSSTTDVAKEQASGVGQQAAEAGQHVAGVAKDQASQVTSEAARQASDLLGQAHSQVKEQANTQQQRLAGSLRSLSDELKSMCSNAENPGLASDLAREASSRTGAMAQWLEGREPGAVVGEVSEYARRRPGTFLAMAAGIGFLAGRLTRGLRDQQQQSSGPDGAGSSWGSQAELQRPRPTPYPTASTMPATTPGMAAPTVAPVPPAAETPAVDLSEPPLPPVSPAPYAEPYAEQVRR